MASKAAPVRQDRDWPHQEPLTGSSEAGPVSFIWRTSYMDLESPSGPEPSPEPSGSLPSWFNRLVMLMTPIAGLIAAVAALITAIRS